MRKKQVAVLDFGSSKLTALVGERGVNKTFVIKGKFTFDYDGFCDGVFFNTDQLIKLLRKAAQSVISAFRGKLETLYVGVPAAFTFVSVKESQIAFAKKKKITEEDLDALYDAAFIMHSSKHTLINRSAIIYELDDFRRLINPVGVNSEILKGRLSFVLCDNYFIENVEPALKNAGISNVEFVSSALSQSLYLIDAETRDRLAVLLDVGYITTSFTVVQGDGMLFQKTFNFGGGYITGAITEQFDIDFDSAEKMKRKLSLSYKADSYDVIGTDSGQYFNVNELQKVVFNCLDAFCEELHTCLEDVKFEIPEFVPLRITGGGISFMRGAKEYLSDRLSVATTVALPVAPVTDNPTESSSLALLDLALEQV